MILEEVPIGQSLYLGIGLVAYAAITVFEGSRVGGLVLIMYSLGGIIQIFLMSREIAKSESQLDQLEKIVEKAEQEGDSLNDL